MYDIFESDFIDFINAINLSETEYIIVGCYAVILQGYLRTTQDIDIWVNKSEQNYTKLTKAFALFGMPVFDMTLQNFLGDDFDVFSFGDLHLELM